MSLKDAYLQNQDEINKENEKKQKEEAEIKAYYGMLDIGKDMGIRYPIGLRHPKLTYISEIPDCIKGKGTFTDYEIERLPDVYKDLFKEAVELVKPDKWNKIDLNYDESLIMTHRVDAFSKFQWYSYDKKITGFQIIDIDGFVGLVNGIGKPIQTQSFEPKRFSNISKTKRLEIEEKAKQYHKDIDRLATKSQCWVQGKVYIGTDSDDESQIMTIKIFDDGNAYNVGNYNVRHPWKTYINYYYDPEKFIVELLNNINREN